MFSVTSEQLAAMVRAALHAILRLPAGVPDGLPDIPIARPGRRAPGEWSTPIALRVADLFGREPHELAVELADRLATTRGIASATVSGPGFVNITPAAGAAGELVRTILAAGVSYGRDGTTADLVHADGQRRFAGRCLDATSAIGSDAVRFALVGAPRWAHPQMDAVRSTRRADDNPVYAVQYAHARTCAFAQRAATAGVRRVDAFAPQLLTHDLDAALLATLGDYPRVVVQAAQRREPQRLVHYLQELTSAYRAWSDLVQVRPPGDDPVTDLHRTRLWVNDATGQVLAGGLALIGVSAPRRL